MIYLYIYICVQSKSSSIPLIACNWTGQATSSTTHCMLQMNRRWYMKIILISDINRTWEPLQDLKLLLCVCGQKLVKNSQVGWKIIQKKLSRPARMWLWIFWMLQMNRLSRCKNTMLWLLEHQWLVDCPTQLTLYDLDLSVVFHDKYQWEIWKNTAGISAR